MKRLNWYLAIILAVWNLNSIAAEPLKEPSGGTPEQEIIEKTGFIRQERSRLDWNRWMGDRILVLNCPEESFSLLRGSDKRVVARVEKFVGKELSIKGIVVPGNRRHPRRGLRVLSYSEVKREMLAPTDLPEFPPIGSGTPPTKKK